MNLTDDLWTPVIIDKRGKIRPPWNHFRYGTWYYHQNIEKLREATNRRYHDGYKYICYEYRERNKEKINARNEKWHDEHPNYRSEYMKSRRKNNPGKVRTEERMKELKRKQRFLYKNLLPEIEVIYANCLETHVVDHIIPLQGKLISGLHVPWNLQYLTPEENNFKRAKFDGTYENESWKVKFEKRKLISSEL